MHQLSPVRCLAILMISSAQLGLVGCTSLSSMSPTGLGLPSASSPPSSEGAQAAVPSVPPLVVEFRPHEDNPDRTQIAWQDTMTVQSALQASRAGKRFSRYKVELHRPSPHGMGMERLGVKYNNAKKKVDPASDYALYPGDRVVVMEDPSTIVSDMLSGAKDTMAVFSTR